MINLLKFADKNKLYRSIYRLYNNSRKPNIKLLELLKKSTQFIIYKTQFENSNNIYKKLDSIELLVKK